MLETNTKIVALKLQYGYTYPLKIIRCIVQCNTKFKNSCCSTERVDLHSFLVSITLVFFSGVPQGSQTDLCSRCTLPLFYTNSPSNRSLLFIVRGERMSAPVPRRHDETRKISEMKLLSALSNWNRHPALRRYGNNFLSTKWDSVASRKKRRMDGMNRTH